MIGEPATEHRLEGLEPDNLLAFMALLGLLRALETARPDWRPRARWSSDGGPLRPLLCLREATTRGCLCSAAAEGTRAWGAALRQVGQAALRPEIERLQVRLDELESVPLTDKLIKEKAKAERRLKKLQQGGAETELAGLAATDKALRDVVDAIAADGEKVWAVLSGVVSPAHDRSGNLIAASTPLKFSSGQQTFVGTLIGLAVHADESALARSLFASWSYSHRGDGLRMSPEEARWYALSSRDPTEKQRGQERGETTGDGIAPSELGANTLGAIGILSFPAIPGRNASTIAWRRDSAGERLNWPICVAETGIGVSLAQLEALLRTWSSWRPATGSVKMVWYGARIFLLNPDLATSQYKNISRGEALLNT